MDFLRSLPDYSWFFDVLNWGFLLLIIGGASLFFHREKKKPPTRGHSGE